MQDLIIKKSTEKVSTTPAISFLVEQGECIMDGKSYMQDAFDFYEPLIEWIENYFTEYDQKTLKFIIKLTYYNTSSSKMLFDLLMTLQKHKDSGQDLTIEWHYDSLDDDLEEDIQDLIDSAEVDIELVEIDEDDE